ncbi:MAG TPA: DsrE family protein [Candidatus Methylomirabilis sp.]|nr:DsrE family protein [Candidatus Methylomirabilis sp.]
MTFGFLLTTSPERADARTVVRLAEAALEAGHRVELFLMNDGVYNVVAVPKHPVSGDFVRLMEAGAAITVCATNTGPRGVTKDAALPGVRFGSQYDHAQMVARADRVLTFC